MEITINWIFGIISSGAIAFIGWSIKELYAQIKNDRSETRLLISELKNKSSAENEKMDNKLYHLEEKLTDKLTEKYVLKEDFYRETNKLDLKLDTIREDIAQLNKNIAAMLGKEKTN